MANMAKKLDAAGADGLVLFNRFYQPDFDLEALEVVPNLILSNSHELLLRLHWIAVLYGSVKADLALTGGVHSATDVVKAMMAGARVAMMTSALLKRGISYLDTIVDRTAGLDGRARIRLHPADAGQHEPQRRAAARGLRARQLHEGARAPTRCGNRWQTGAGAGQEARPRPPAVLSPLVPRHRLNLIVTGPLSSTT